MTTMKRERTDHMASIPPHFAQWLTVSMDNAGLSGRKLAKMLGTTSTAVSKWTTGAAVPSIENIGKIAQIFEVPPSRLLATARGVEWGEPLPLPTKHAYRDRIKRYIRSAPDIDEADAKAVGELFEALHIMREKGGGTQELHATLEKLRAVVRDKEGELE
jgi:transcriptional regulator with XRE-family HTH domain